MIKKQGNSISLKLIDGIPLMKIIGKLSDIREPDLNWELFAKVNGLQGVKTLLLDISDLHGRPGIVSTYYHVRECPYYDLFSKIAIIDRIENKDYYSFHENTANNAGHNIRYFTEAEEAMSWLKKNTAGSSAGKFTAFPFSEELVSI